MNEELTRKLHRPIIKKFKRRKFFARFKDNISAADFTEMRLLSFFNQKIKYLLCVIDVFTKYVQVKPFQT